MADDVSSAPVTASGNVWERPWDMAEMRGLAGRWSLAGDAGLLLHLQNFSQQLLAKTHDMQKKLSDVDREAKMTGVRMNNVLSDFIMLANKQFVENRVYDEDESLTEGSKATSTESQDKTPEQREADLIPKISEALSQGLSVLDAAYEKVEIRSESQEGDTTHMRTETLLAPKDPYSNRRLPHLIGTIHFMQDDHLGLADVIAEEEAEGVTEAEQDVESESEEDSDGGDTKIPTSHVRTKQHRVPDWSDDNDSESEDDLFATHSKHPQENPAMEEEYEPEEDMFQSESRQKNSQSDQDSMSQENTKEDHAPSFLDELANKVRAPQANQSNMNKGKQSQGTTSKQSKKNTSSTNKQAVAGGDDIFAEVRGRAVDENEVDDDIFVQTSGKFSSRGGGLFDDDDEEGGLFGTPSTNKKSSENKPKSQPSKTDTDISPKNSTSVSSRKHGKSPAVGKPASSGLFGGDDSEDENDIFASAARSTSKTKSRPPDSRGGGGGGLFGEDSPSADDDQDSLFNESITQKKTTAKDSSTKKKLPPGGVPMFGAGGNPLMSSLRKQHEDTTTDESGSDTEDDRRSSQPDTDTSSSGNMDLRTAVRKSTTQRRPQGIQVLPTPATSNPPGGTTSGALFDDNTSDIFSETTTKSVKTSDNQRPGSGNNKVRVKANDGLFGHEEDDNLFASKTSQQSKTSKPAPSGGGSGLFGADDEEDDLFSGFSKPTSSLSTQKASSKPKKTVLSLFDDDAEEDEEDIFAAVTSVKKTQPANNPVEKHSTDVENKPKSPVKSSGKSSGKSGVFEDEDVLFGGGVEEDPAVDLFGASSPLSSPTKTTNQPSMPDTFPSQHKDTYSSSSSTHSQGGSTSKMSSGPSLFDDNEDEDLFAATDKKKRTSEGKSPDVGRDMHAQAKITPVKSNVTPTVKKVHSIFDDDDEEDLFASSSSSAKTSSKPSPLSSEQSIFSEPVTNNSSTATKKRDDGLRKPAHVPTSDPDPLGSADEVISNTSHLNKKPTKSQQHPVVTTKTLEEEETARGKPSAMEQTEAEEEEDLFRITNDTRTSAPTAPVASNKLPTGLPAGAVSLFGGMNPASILRTSKVGGHMKGHIGDDDNDEQGEQLGAAAAATSDVQASANTSAALEDVGFDQPARAATLHSATKDRARITRNRRPPSRRTRSRGAAIPGDEVTTNGEVDWDPSGSVGVHRTVPEPIPQSASDTPLAGDDPDALLRDNTSLPNGVDSNLANYAENNDRHRGKHLHEVSEGDGIFHESESTTKDSLFDSENIFDTSSVKVPRTSQEKLREDLFNVESSTRDIMDKQGVKEQNKAEEDIFGTTVSKPTSTMAARPKESKSVLIKGDNDEDYDIFSDDAMVKTKSTNKSKQSGDIFSKSDTQSDDGDIFQTSSSSSSSSSHNKPAVAAVNIFNDNDDDLFGGASAAKPKAKANKPATNKADDFDIFSSSKDEEDIFSSSASSKSSNKSKDSKSKISSKSKSKAIEDIFADDTDIFSDVPASKPRPQKVKKNPSANLFSDDVDDIFADAKPVKKAPKSSTSKNPKTKPASQNAKAVIDDIFGDSSASIFDDPLSATKR